MNNKIENLNLANEKQTVEDILTILIDKEMPLWDIAQYWKHDTDLFLENELLTENQVEELRKTSCHEELLISLSDKELPALTDQAKRAIEKGVDQYSTWGIIADWECGILDYDYDEVFYNYQDNVVKTSNFTFDDVLLAAYRYAVEYESRSMAEAVDAL